MELSAEVHGLRVGGRCVGGRSKPAPLRTEKSLELSAEVHGLRVGGCYVGGRSRPAPLRMEKSLELSAEVHGLRVGRRYVGGRSKPAPLRADLRVGAAETWMDWSGGSVRLFAACAFSSFERESSLCRPVLEPSVFAPCVCNPKLRGIRRAQKSQARGWDCRQPYPVYHRDNTMSIVLR